MTSIESTSRNAVASRTRLPDPATAPAIPGLSVRAFRDRTDYAHLADLEGTANLADGIPYLPTAARSRSRWRTRTARRRRTTSCWSRWTAGRWPRPGSSAPSAKTRQYEVWGTVEPACAAAVSGRG